MGLGSHDPAKAEEWKLAPLNSRSGDASGSSVEGGLGKRWLILRGETTVSEEISTPWEGCKEAIARGEKSKMEFVVISAVG